MAAMLFQAAFWGTADRVPPKSLPKRDKFASRSHVGWSFDRCWIFGPVPWIERPGAQDRLHEIFFRFLYFSLNIIFLMK